MLLNSIKLRSIYIQIQNKLFNLIPERWSKIYLYASVSEKINNIETGEMFFYYFPKGILKKNPVNVYEVPSKFNIDEKSYLDLVDELYNLIKKLRVQFSKQNEKCLWSSITIILENNKFTIKYNFEDLLGSKYTSYDRHIIFKYEYLNMPIEILSRKDRKMLENYYEDLEKENINQQEYTEEIYNKAHNIIEYDREEKNIDIVVSKNIENKKAKGKQEEINQILKIN